MFSRTDRQPVSGRVVVVTGASAGVGRATAAEFARRGAKVALIAREEAALEETRAEIVADGGQALAVPADVADADAVFAAADRIAKELGPISVWVNDAMLTVYSPVADMTPEEFRRVTEVTYLGFVHGTMAALKHMRPRNRGTIVQVGSSLAYRGIPLQSAYCGAKHAIRGFTDSLRSELIHDDSRIRVTMVNLPAVNTPQFDWAREHTGRVPRPVPPVIQPAVAGRAIVEAAIGAEREYWLGASTVKTILGSMVAPGFLDRYLARVAYDGQQSDERTRDGRPDNLDEPVHDLHRTRGSHGAEASDRAALVSGSDVRLALAGIGVVAFATASMLVAPLFNGRSDRDRPARSANRNRWPR